MRSGSRVDEVAAVHLRLPVDSCSTFSAPSLTYKHNRLTEMVILLEQWAKPTAFLGWTHGIPLVYRLRE